MTKEQLQSLLESLTLEEKVGQLVQCNAGQFIKNQMEITGPEGEMLPAEDLNRVMGSVLTFEDASQAKALQEKHLAADPKKIPLLLMLDVIHGLRTTYPIPLAMGCSFDDSLMAECADMARGIRRLRRPCHLQPHGGYSPGRAVGAHHGNQFRRAPDQQPDGGRRHPGHPGGGPRESGKRCLLCQALRSLRRRGSRTGLQWGGALGADSAGNLSPGL